jgi:hypothetical protein
VEFKGSLYRTRQMGTVRNRDRMTRRQQSRCPHKDCHSRRHKKTTPIGVEEKCHGGLGRKYSMRIELLKGAPDRNGGFHLHVPLSARLPSLGDGSPPLLLVPDAELVAQLRLSSNILESCTIKNILTGRLSVKIATPICALRQ